MVRKTGEGCAESVKALLYAAAFAQAAQKKANPQSGSPGLLCLSVNSPEPPASEPSWAGTSATACSGS